MLVAPPLCAQGAGPLKQHLPNGLRIVVADNDHTATVVVSAMVRVTALHEPRGAGGIRQLTQSLLAGGEGCQEEMQRAAVRAEAAVAPDYVELSLAAPAESLEDCARLMRRMLFRPELSEEALELVRPRLVRNLAAREEVPATIAIDRLYQALYPGIGSGDTAAGDPLEVAALTLADVRDFHASHYLPNATVVAVSGGVDGTRALELVAAQMRGLLPGALPAKAPEPAPGSAAGTQEIAVGGRTSVFTVGGRAVALDSPSYPAMATGMVLLGSGMDSRLYRALRVERSLAYTIAAELTPSATAPSGLVLVTCDPAHLDEVEQVVEAEIARVVSEPAQAEELRRAKRYLIGRHALRRQRNYEIAHYLAMFELLGGPQGYRRDAQLAGEIASVDADAVTRAMSELFRPAWAVRLRAGGTGAD
ncbi:MAG: M16 family metallopeptidase [Armatimonadota bacterium]